VNILTNQTPEQILAGAGEVRKKAEFIVSNNGGEVTHNTLVLCVAQVADIATVMATQITTLQALVSKQKEEMAAMKVKLDAAYDMIGEGAAALHVEGKPDGE
jgi:hypothetical protein